MHHVGPGREIAASYRNAGDGPCLFFSVGRTGMYVAVFLGDVSLVRAFRYVGPFLLRAATVSRVSPAGRICCPAAVFLIRGGLS